MEKRFRSCALWGDDVYSDAYGKHVSTDDFHTEDEANGVNNLLWEHGFGGNGEEPRATWIKNLETGEYTYFNGPIGLIPTTPQCSESQHKEEWAKQANALTLEIPESIKDTIREQTLRDSGIVMLQSDVKHQRQQVMEAMGVSLKDVRATPPRIREGKPISEEEAKAFDRDMSRDQEITEMFLETADGHAKRKALAHAAAYGMSPQDMRKLTRARKVPPRHNDEDVAAKYREERRERKAEAFKKRGK